ncbi:MAG TPA: hypothetical protein PKA90_13235, partial [Ignavibacteria bacterium]|nr:hypothetical protein [Ignavibacteria bacterium]HMR41382.1 hypothetical protein [Ignavibacteria bacterium]
MKKFAPGYSGDNFTREYLWKKTFSDKKFNYGTLKNLLHELTKLSQKFLVFESLGSNKHIQENFLIEQLLTRDAGNLSKQRQRAFWKDFSGVNKKDSVIPIDAKYHMASEIFWYNTVLKKIRKLKAPKENEYFTGASYSTIEYYISICKAYNNIIADSHDINIKFDRQVPVIIVKALNSGIMDELLKEIKGYSQKDYNVLDTFVSMNKAQIHPGNSLLYHEFKNKLIQNSKLFSKNDLRDLYNCLGTILSALDSSENIVSLEMVSHYDLMSEHGILTDNNGKLSSIYYYYYLIVAFRILNFDKIEAFAKKYLFITTGESPDNLENFTAAMISFGRKDYDEALRRISLMNKLSVFIDCFIREFRVCCYYELNESGLFESEKKSIYHLIKNYRVHYPRMKTELEFHLRTIGKLFSLRENFDKQAFKSLSVSIPKSRVWLLQKLDEIGIKFRKFKIVNSQKMSRLI